MAVNLRGPMLCAKHTIPHMLKQGGGSVISTGSTKALQGDIAQTAYGASKAGVHNLTYNIAAQYGKQGIRANVLMVGLVLSGARSEEHTSELQSLMRISYAVFCLKKKNYVIRTSQTYTKDCNPHKQ